MFFRGCFGAPRKLTFSPPSEACATNCPTVAAFHPINSSESPYFLIFPLWPPHCLLTVVDTTHNSHRSPSGGQHPWLRRQPHCDRLPGRRRCFSSRHRPPTFLWRDSSPAAAWLIEIVFAGRGSRFKVWSAGEKLQVGEIDTKLHGFVPPTLTPKEAESHTWKPDAKTWAAIVQHAQRQPATAVDHRFSRPQYERAAFPRAGRHGRFR